MPKVTVIIPAYNAEQTIIAAIASVQQQTYRDWEVIVIDDGSCDRTCELLNRIQEPRMQVHRYTNSGVSLARNRGIARAKGELIAFLDADDLWSPDKLECQVAALEQHPSAAVAYSWTYFMNDTATIVHAAPPVWCQGDVYAQLLVRNFLYSGSNALVRRDALAVVGGFDATLTHGEDWELFVRLAAIFEFVVVPKAQVFYRHSPTSASAQVELMEPRLQQVIDQVFAAAPPELQSLKNENLATLYQYLTQLLLKHISNPNSVKQAHQMLWKGICIYPRTLLDNQTQILLIKIIFFRIFSYKLAIYFLGFVSKKRATAVFFNY
ncbi:glycosyltransferase family 2 protein [Chroogloeocystis siderophila]|jgi:glycosyltransferase involved in cell wall biosynthesis|uniref:Glycosyl transferase family A n=1 Tax=Chroogloeocystis siderophila 5.2 s.c.1 TaxID=247279 RepID=A0A1U7HQM0_9CHRO|nr:glycosyltransferase family A protein [Chroogloeocystis siderophila]OKH25861.1 glycosyl transferase family A [Chroogloeocystis siderophila 5.2 s.c.1]